MGTPFSWCGCQVGRGEEGWGGVGRDVWTEATGSQRSGQQTAAAGGGEAKDTSPGGGPTLLLTSCAQGARPETPHPHPSQVKRTQPGSSSAQFNEAHVTDS